MNMHLRNSRGWFVILIMGLAFTGCNKNFGDLPPPGPKWRVFTKESTPIVDNVVNAVAIDAQGIVWFGTNHGASSLQSTVWASYIAPLAFLTSGQGGADTSYAVQSITTSVDGSTWFGLAGGGIRRYLPNSAGHVWTSYSSNDLPDGPSGDNIWQMATDQYTQTGVNEIWFIPFGGGVSVFTPDAANPLTGVWKQYGYPGALPSNYIYSVQVNYSRRLIYFGSNLGDLASFDGLLWSYDHVYNGEIKCISFEGANGIWLGTVDGVFTKRNGAWVKLTTADGLPSNNIHDITVDVQGVKWIASDGGFTRFDNSTWTTFTHTNSPLLTDTVNALAIGRDGKIWMGTSQGAAVYDPYGI